MLSFGWQGALDDYDASPSAYLGPNQDRALLTTKPYGLTHVH